MTRGLTKGSLAAIREETCLTRWGWGGRLETLAYANRRSLLDIAQASVMRDRLSGGGEAVATWSDVTWEPDGSGRLLVRRSKTDLEGIGTVPFPSRQTVEDQWATRPEDSTGDDPVFGLSAQQFRHWLRAWARSSRDTAPGSGLPRSWIELPALMTAGRWSGSTLPARHTRAQLAGRGAVGRYYGE